MSSKEQIRQGKRGEKEIEVISILKKYHLSRDLNSMRKTSYG